MTDDDKKDNANPPQSDASAVTPAIAIPEPKVVHSLEEYIRETGKFYSELGPLLFFRGHADANRPLVPSIFRWLGNNPTQKQVEICRHEEVQANLRFCNKARAIEREFPNDNDRMGQLVVMRHHNLHSRLLDWTAASWTALLFAVAKNAVYLDSKQNSCVWVLAPYVLNRKSGLKLFTQKDVLLPDNVPFLQEMAECAFNDNRIAKDVILPMLPRYTSARHVAQDAVFTMHGFHRPLDDFQDKTTFLRQIIIPQKFQWKIYVDLRCAGKTWASMFPDLDGLAKRFNIDAEIELNKMG